MFRCPVMRRSQKKNKMKRYEAEEVVRNGPLRASQSVFQGGRPMLSRDQAGTPRKLRSDNWPLHFPTAQ